ncbi:TetR/AcrR family transcriptional regulator [Brachybacterium sp. ACRRE]|uniref:TetR/AcrR family transcriptional regulator n=1 Tax=Brachybacterium sp. ACRRE TaxID=2918184 RepID=UPI001EF28AB8|nr:TetR/AcrR family transcriptional regulator [Brachybacterium sp. ACRRE]
MSEGSAAQHQPRYHHGDLPATLVRTAIAMLDADGDTHLSLRAVAREAGVSSAAPYRHFPDRRALLDAVSAVGFEDLMAALTAEHPQPEDASQLADGAVAYVRFALGRPGLFRVMFLGEGGRTEPARRRITDQIHAHLDAAVQRVFGVDDPAPVTTGLWSLVHGMACLYLYGNLVPATDDEIAERVRTTVAATVGVRTR